MPVPTRGEMDSYKNNFLPTSKKEREIGVYYEYGRVGNSCRYFCCINSSGVKICLSPCLSCYGSRQLRLSSVVALLSSSPSLFITAMFCFPRTVMSAHQACIFTAVLLAGSKSCRRFRTLHTIFHSWQTPNHFEHGWVIKMK